MAPNSSSGAVVMDANIVVLNRGYDQTFQTREQSLIETLAGYGELAVSFSGRLESCYSMDLCRASGIRIRAITLDSPTRSRKEVARAKRYCQRYGIEQRVIKTDEMIFCDHLRHLNEVIDPVRYICHLTALETDWSHLPMLLPAPVEELQEYLRRFGSLPTNTLWLFAKQGMTHRDFRYGFNKRQLGRWGKSAHGCLSYRFSDPELVERRHLRMVDMAEQMLADMGLEEAQVFFHTLADRATTLARVRVPARLRAQAFDLQPDILTALKSTAFDLVTLDMAAEEERQELVV
ncbi:hypothetical protein ACQ2HG_00975 [Aeromonas hydrophila]|mgnify:FL=1|uniref:Uncharacterized protein n=3 Tax=Aeromonas hydrophila TaxID=644 RepID=A0KH87_AERHH|nr:MULTISPECIES: hypothetical protein [Aeromonas]ABK39833.1 conserved hypothetical protein [Aeromonas hydrophila subsp. hydrophila ATCC 7966]ANT66952.1 hypothetical protein TK34_05455 [Aeromonas hydrophila]APJ14355.1 hypothetical protein BOQ57_05290 [Aeromonas hydrophila]AUZ76270.1 hypothetical protein C2U40_16425 [Aeromonas sp. ASNIH4]AVP83488.1 hypothetical protein C7K70_05150 [Aeromonas hydrophila]